MSLLAISPGIVLAGETVQEPWNPLPMPVATGFIAISVNPKAFSGPLVHTNAATFQSNDPLVNEDDI